MSLKVTAEDHSLQTAHSSAAVPPRAQSLGREGGLGTHVPKTPQDEIGNRPRVSAPLIGPSRRINGPFSGRLPMPAPLAQERQARLVLLLVGGTTTTVCRQCRVSMPKPAMPRCRDALVGSACEIRLGTRVDRRVSTRTRPSQIQTPSVGRQCRERQDMAAAASTATGWAREDPEICDGNHLAAGDSLRARAACRLVASSSD